MRLGNKKKIQNIGSLIFDMVIVLYAMLYISGRKITWLKEVLPDWMQRNAVHTIVAITFLYALFLLWCNVFIKTPWRKKDYSPLLAIILIIIFYLMQQ
jgi:hypothetical protein